MGQPGVWEGTVNAGPSQDSFKRNNLIFGKCVRFLAGSDEKLSITCTCKASVRLFECARLQRSAGKSNVCVHVEFAASSVHSEYVGTHQWMYERDSKLAGKYYNNSSYAMC